MLKILEFTDNGPRKIESINHNSWVHAISPGDDDLSQLQELGIPSELLIHVLDFDERSRVAKRGDIIFIVIHFPYQQEIETEIPYATAPISIILLPDYIVTIESRDIDLYEKLIKNQPEEISLHEMTHFLLNIVLQAASDYLIYLSNINREVDSVEDKLQRSLRNQEVLELLNYQKSLVYFSTSLNSIEIMVDKLLKGDYLQFSPEDRVSAEDALIEIRQAVYHVDIAQNILTQMMDAFASIVSNNLNTVMKFLAAITIVISIPTLIASLYGMNVSLPGESNALVFIYLVGLSIILSMLVIFLFRKMDWL
jgi:magnesium transporter